MNTVDICDSKFKSDFVIDTKIVKDISNIFENKICPHNLTLGALLVFQPTVKGRVAFCQKWIKFSLATHRNCLL